MTDNPPTQEREQMCYCGHERKYHEYTGYCTAYKCKCNWFENRYK